MRVLHRMEVIEIKKENREYLCKCPSDHYQPHTSNVTTEKITNNILWARIKSSGETGSLHVLDISIDTFNSSLCNII